MSGVPLVQWPPPEEPLEPIAESDDWAGTGSADDDWPPRDEQSTETDWCAPAAQHPKHPKPQPSGPMQALQKVVDESTDDELRWMRARGCDLMPKRWGGVDAR